MPILVFPSVNRRKKLTVAARDSINAANEGRQLTGLQPATAQQQADALKELKRHPRAGDGLVREDEPPRSVAMGQGGRRIAPAHAHESSGKQHKTLLSISMYIC